LRSSRRLAIWVLAALAGTLACDAAAQQSEIIELRVDGCTPAGPQDLQRISPFVRECPLSLSESILAETPGIILHGRQERSRLLDLPCPAARAFGKRETIGEWATDRRKRDVFVPVSGEFACEYFHNGQTHLLVTGKTNCPSDEVGPPPSSADWHDEARGYLLRGGSLRLLPDDYGGRLAGSTPAIFVSKDAPPAPITSGPPDALRAILGSRTHVVELRSLPRLNRREKETRPQVFVDIEPIAESPILCARGGCWSTSSAKRMVGDGPLVEVGYSLPSDVANEVIEAFSAAFREHRAIQDRE
jgi:hypothetical protein